MSIPRTIHFVWLNPPMPEWAESNIAGFAHLNPEFLCQIHGDERLSPWLCPIYDRIEGEHVWSRRSDLVRISILVRYGGWYFDTDFLPVRPLSELYRDQGNFPRGAYVAVGDMVAEDHDPNGQQTRAWIANGIIGAEADSPFLACILRGILMNGDQLSWDAFGPKLFTETVDRFPGIVHVGRQDDWFRLESAEDRQAAYKRIRNAGYTNEAIREELGDCLPYAFHQDMQDQLEL